MLRFFKPNPRKKITKQIHPIVTDSEPDEFVFSAYELEKPQKPIMPSVPPSILLDKGKEKIYNKIADNIYHENSLEGTKLTSDEIDIIHGDDFLTKILDLDTIYVFKKQEYEEKKKENKELETFGGRRRRKSKRRGRRRSGGKSKRSGGKSKRSGGRRKSGIKSKRRRS